LEHKSEDKSSQIESSNVDEEKLRIFSLEQRSRGDSVEELKAFNVLVNRWQLPTNQSEGAGWFINSSIKAMLKSIPNVNSQLN
jgi:hypothetical protein